MTEADGTPVVSVIIPAFNASAYVGQAVSSALATRGVPIEVLVIDDQSADNTWAILEGFGDTIRKVRQEKGGPYRARNLGARLARGEWLAFLDADDEWVPDKLSRQLTLADDQTGLIYTDRINFDVRRGIAEKFSDYVQLWEGDVFENLLLGNFITLSSVIMRKSWFERLGGFSESNIGVQDWDLWLRYSSSGTAVKLLREPVTRYRIHSGQMTQDLDRRTSEQLTVLKRALLSPRGQKVSHRIARQAVANVWEFGARQIVSTRRLKAISWYLRAAKHWPWNLRLYKGMIKCCLGYA